jgi:hypothetical protein
MKRGAWREHPAETRAALVKRAFAAGGTVVLGGVAIAGLPRSAISAPSPKQDVEVLNLALLLEYLESAFFAEASVRGGLSGELLEFADVVRGHERAHVAFLRRVLGRKARKRPRFDFGDATRDRDEFTEIATQLQDLMVAAYNGQAANLTKGALASAARIVSVEARHAGWIRAIADKSPAPLATDTPQTAKGVTEALTTLGFLRSE